MKKRKIVGKLLFICLFALFLLDIYRKYGVELSRKNGVSVHGALRVEGVGLVNERGESIALRGTSSHGIMWYPRYLNGQAMKTLSEYGANVQRISMYIDAGYLEHPRESLNYLYMGVESVLGADMYAIVDWHVLREQDPNRNVEEAKRFFYQISSHYGNHPGILYEICNEPNGDTTWEDVVKYAESVIPIIRKHAPDAIILVGVPNYCTDFSGPLKNPLPYENLMYVLHRYVDVSEKKPDNFYLLRKLVKANIPVFVSEWGITYKWEDMLSEEMDHTILRLYVENAKPFLDYMEEQHISWTAWSLSNANECHSMIRRDCEKLSGWEKEDLTEFGSLVFGSFR